MKRLTMTPEDIQAEGDKAKQGLIRQTAQRILQSWVEATPGADVAFVEENASVALATAAALLDAKDAIGRE